MFDRLSIRTKLIAMVAAPLVVIVALAGLGFGQRRAEAATTRDDARRLRAIEASLELQHELQVETLFSVGYLASEGELHADDLEEQWARTNAAADRLTEATEPLEGDAALSAGQGALRQIEALDGNLRAQVSEQRLEWPFAESLYLNLDGALPPFNERLAAQIEDRDVAAGAQSIVALGTYSSTTATVGATLQGASAGDGFSSQADALTDRGSFLETVDRSETELAIVNAEADDGVRARLRNQMVGGTSFFSDQVEEVREQSSGAGLGIDAGEWSDATEATLDQIRDITAGEATSVLAAADEQVSQSESAARLFLAAALLAVLIAVGLAVYVAATIARPLLSLTKAADHVAREQLPQMVEALRNPAEDSVEALGREIGSLDVGGGKELARLTESVNSIQEVAVDVATEQATLLRKGIGDMFVNLARRNQALLDRQLEFIDQLEAAEEDPEGLESLFKLDHMATRMRRNAESLLVLAGAEPARRRGQPVPLAKVTLAAVGEIEHFSRVDLLEVDECEVTSKAAADIAHLLSELMENATQFSPPDTRVEVVGHRHQAPGYTVSITDQGIGMSPDQLVEANQMLARPPLLGLSLARTLGFIVVGRLAARHGITVRLVASPAGGVTAIVNLPTAVLVGGSSARTLDLTGAEKGAGDPPPLPSDRGLEPPFPSDLEPAPEIDAPATLEEAVPTGEPFEVGLSEVTGADPAPVCAPDGRDATVGTPIDAPEPLPRELVAPVGRAGDGQALPSRPRRQADAPPPGAIRSSAPPRLFSNGSGPQTSNGVAAPGGHLFGSLPEPPSSRSASGPASDSSIAEPQVTAEPARTSAGLVKRVPRAAGASRAVPGSDGPERGGATTSARSPDEVRSMLSRFHSGRQAGQVPSDDAPPTGASGAAPTPFEDD